MSPPVISPSADPHVAGLAALFRDHPVWQGAARLVDERATSAVYFSHRPGEPWRLVRRGGRTVLEPGPAPDPDFVFRFTPAAIARLAATAGDMGAFATTLFELIVTDDENERVGFRIAAGFPRLVARGYLRLLLAAGPAVLRFGVAHGIATLHALRRLVGELRRRPPAPWETPGPAPRS